ncbi:polysaccharide transporter, PST family [Janthinobacterium sp. CG_23.3]|uniref:oligosaccharide flippase family protein n=1 Tax=Janthinobacterium sp. CG_23.3 TaxID=3349634 RepID=UPI0038D3E00D
MSSVAINAAWLLLAQIGGLLIPLIELPILARALGQQGYGEIMYALGIAMTAAVFVEFGFSFSAARRVVGANGDRAALGQLVADVLCAKLMLSAAVGVVIAAIMLFGTGATALPSHWFIWIAMFTVAFGFSPIWYYFGTEKLMLPAMLDFGLRGTGLLLVILTVSTPQHTERVLLIQASIGVLNTLVPTLAMLRQTGIGRFEVGGGWRVLRESWDLFLYKGAQAVMGSVASTMLGGLGGARAVGTFVPAEKLVRAATGLAGPLLNAAFPHLVRMQSTSQSEAKKSVGIWLIALALATVAFAATTTVLAPWVVHLAFGPGYTDAVPLLRMLVWIVPMRVCSMAVGILWFIPTGREQLASRVMIMNIGVICLLALWLVPTLGAIGMAAAFFCAEAMSCVALAYFFAKK